MEKLYIITGPSKEVLKRKVAGKLGSRFFDTLPEVAVVDLWKYGPYSKDTVAKMLGLKVFDTALPKAFVADVVEKTGINISPHVVWSYDHCHLGSPVAVTRVGEITLQIYNHIANRSS